MTVQPDPGFHRVRWWVVMISFVVTFGLIGAGIAAVYNQGQAQRREQQQRNAAIEAAVNGVRIPVCAIMYAALSRPVAGLTQEQIEARQVYIDAYGPGTPEAPGLRCSQPLPTPASGG